MVADGPVEARRHHFGRRFGRELGAPLALARPLHVVAAAESGALDADDGVGGRRIGREALAADAPEQVAARVGFDPELRELRGRRRARQRGLDRGMARETKPGRGDQ